MITTVTGANDFARNQAVKEAVHAFIAEHGDFGLERLDGEEASFEQMRSSAESMPFLTPRKLVVLREPSKQKQFSEQIDSFIAACHDAVDVLIIEPKLDKRLAYYKTLKKQTGFCEFPDLDASALARWAVQYATEQGGTLQLPDARQLIERLGVNQQLVQQEVRKLLAYSPAITADSISLLVDRLPQSTVFELLDAAFGGRQARTLALYAEQRALKVEPQAIIAMLVWQLHIVTVIKTAGSRGADEIAKTAKLSPFVVRKSQGLARAVTLSRLRQLVAELLVLDKRLKSEPLSADDAVQAYLLKLSV